VVDFVNLSLMKY